MEHSKVWQFQAKISLYRRTSKKINHFLHKTEIESLKIYETKGKQIHMLQAMRKAKAQLREFPTVYT